MEMNSTGNHIEKYKLVSLSPEPHTRGQRAADFVAGVVGSWKFIIIQSLLLVVWVVLNSVLVMMGRWDPYPFILMNLLLSLEAAYTAPMIMMSQNRQTLKDRHVAQRDLVVSIQTESDVSDLRTVLDEQNKTIQELLSTLEEIRKKVC